MKKVSNLQYMLWMMMMMIIFIFSPQNSKIRICMDMYALCWIYRVYHLMVFYNFPNNSHLTRLSNHIWLMKWVRSTKGDSPKKKTRSYHQNSIVLKSINDPIDTVHQQIISKFINFFFFSFFFLSVLKNHMPAYGEEKEILWKMTNTHNLFRSIYRFPSRYISVHTRIRTKRKSILANVIY